MYPNDSKEGELERAQHAAHYYNWRLTHYSVIMGDDLYKPFVFEHDWGLNEAASIRFRVGGTRIDPDSVESLSGMSVEYTDADYQCIVCGANRV